MGDGGGIRKPLLEWMTDGDPELVPVLLDSPVSTASSYFDCPVREDGVSGSITYGGQTPVTVEMVVQCGRELGVPFHVGIGGGSAFDAIEFVDTIELSVDEKVEPDRVLRLTTIRTPAGTMNEVFVTPAGDPACWVEHLVKSEADFPALAYLVEHGSMAMLEDDRVRAKVIARQKWEIARWPAWTTFTACFGVPAFNLTSNLYMDPANAFYLLHDHKPQMERLFELEAEATAAAVGWAAEAGADTIRGAINGLELYSPQIYLDYFVPQTRALHDEAHKHGLMTWVHTCGHMQELIDMGVYDEMALDVLESLSAPPLGTVADLRAARRKIGGRVVTRGAVNVSDFYNADLDQIRARARYVLEATRGYRHMIGDTNDSFPPYRRDAVLALVDEVRASGRMFDIAEHVG